MKMDLSRLAAKQETWVDLCRRDPELGGYRTRGSIRLGIKDESTMVSVDVDAKGVCSGGDPEVTLVAPGRAWAELLSRDPEPTMHHFLAMRMRVDGTRIEGSELRFAQSAHIIRRLIELAREAVDAPIDRTPDPVIDREAISGSYVPITLDGKTTQIYVERAGRGTGTPILVLHTAGSDGRQAHPLMSDNELTKVHPVVTFDMPGHGKSTSVAGARGGWTLSPELYRAVILAVVDGLALDRPVLLGASMGGEACLMMALYHPDRFRGVIACEAAEYVPGRLTPWAGHAEVNEMTFVPEWIDGLISPVAPNSMRDLIWQTYSQGGHRIFAGDIDFYSGGWDGRGYMGNIDTVVCPVVMMTGEYDYSCTPEMSAATAEKIRGAHFWTMPGLGHFPICENPEKFRPHLDQALAIIGEHHA